MGLKSLYMGLQRRTWALKTGNLMLNISSTSDIFDTMLYKAARSQFPFHGL